MGAVAKHYKVSEIKQKLMRPAQTSVYAVNITTNGGATDLASQRGVSKTKHHEMINLACCEASLPGSSLATHEVNNDYHGSTEKMVYRRIYDDTIDLTFYVDYEYAVIKYFQSWMNHIVGEGGYFSSNDYRDNETFYRMTYPDSYKSSIHLVKFEKDISKNSSRPTLEYEFIQAFPINMVSVPVSYDASDLLKLTVSFAYTRYVMLGTGSFYSDSSSGIPSVGNIDNNFSTDPNFQVAYNGSLNSDTSWNDSFSYNSNVSTGVAYNDSTNLYTGYSGESKGVTQADINTGIEQELALQKQGVPAKQIDIY